MEDKKWIVFGALMLGLIAAVSGLVWATQPERQRAIMR